MRHGLRPWTVTKGLKMVKRLPAIRTADPAASLFTLTEIKGHVRRDDTDDDTYIQTLIDAVESYLDGYDGILGLMLVNQSWKDMFSGFPADDVLQLSLMPVSTIDSITYYDSDNVQQTLSAGDYTVHDGFSFSYVKLDTDASWPSTYERDDAVTVTYTGGYGAAGSDVPAAIRHAGKLLIGHYYENREAVGTVSFSTLPMAVQSLLRPHKRPIFELEG
jgi:uncharacterized phiE125 gp8 family phage protein